MAVPGVRSEVFLPSKDFVCYAIVVGLVADLRSCIVACFCLCLYHAASIPVLMMGWDTRSIPPFNLRV